METLIPTYASDGRRLRDYSLGAVLRLAALSKVVVRRNRRTGAVKWAQFRPPAGANPLRAVCRMGQRRYSYREQVGEYRAWRHAAGLTPNDPEQDRFLQGVFRAVPLSCMVCYLSCARM